MFKIVAFDFKDFQWSVQSTEKTAPVQPLYPEVVRF